MQRSDAGRAAPGFTRRAEAWSQAVIVGGLLLAGACSGSKGAGAPGASDGSEAREGREDGGGSEARSEDAGAGRDGSQVGAGAAEELPCSSPISSLDEAPTTAELSEKGGTVLRCAAITALDASAVDRLARSSGYVGDPLAVSARVLHLTYRTERGTDPPTPGFGGAVVLWPAAPRAARLPVIVMAHGTVGQAPSCPPSRESPDAPETYLAELGYALVGAGYAVILPDFAGYAAFGTANNPPPGYHSAADEAKSVLDAARALRSLAPSRFSEHVVLMGHSQGGHAALSALEHHAAYGSGGKLAGVVTYAPSWFPMSSFGAMIALAPSFPLPEEANTVAASVWYHYSQAELLDGPGAGPLVFAEAKRDAIRTFFENSCDPAELATLGADVGELFDAGFATEVAYVAGLGLPCVTERCTTWIKRYAADRPHLTGPAKNVPILLVHGDQDDWIPAERATCGFDRLEQDGANVTFCIVPGALHDPVVGMKSAYVSRWIAHLTLGEPDPGTCGLSRDALRDDAGQTASCAALPPND